MDNFQLNSYPFSRFFSGAKNYPYYYREAWELMKYFTKEWYERSQKTCFHLPLEEEKQAEACSEEYF